MGAGAPDTRPGKMPKGVRRVCDGPDLESDLKAASWSCTYSIPRPLVSYLTNITKVMSELQSLVDEWLRLDPVSHVMPNRVLTSVCLDIC